jgi:tRNA (guanine-N7-)-methyltransferase
MYCNKAFFIFAAMAQKKLIRFAAIKAFNNVLEYPTGMQGKWHQHFNNANNIVLELACGRGEYTVGLAALYPNANFIGVDIKGNRMYIGAKKCIENKVANAAFLRTQIAMLPNYFNTQEVHAIWITFPDPQLRGSKAKKRLTHPQFLALYQQIIHQNGCIHLKTDSPKLYSFTKKVIELYQLTLVEDFDNVYQQSTNNVLKIKTHYESLDIANSKRIFYLQFSLANAINFNNNEKLAILKEFEASLPVT